MRAEYKKLSGDCLRDGLYATFSRVRGLSTVSNTIEDMGMDSVLWSADYLYERHEDATEKSEGERRCVSDTAERRLETIAMACRVRLISLRF